MPGLKSSVTGALPVVTEDLFDLQFTLTNMLLGVTDSIVVAATIGSGA